MLYRIITRAGVWVKDYPTEEMANFCIDLLVRDKPHLGRRQDYRLVPVPEPYDPPDIHVFCG